MRLDKPFEVCEILRASADEISRSNYAMESYELAIKIIKWKIETEKDEASRNKLKSQLRACIIQAAKSYYPWLEMCEQMARDIAMKRVKQFETLEDVLNYYRKRAFDDTPDLWRKNCGRIYRGSEHNFLQL